MTIHALLIGINAYPVAPLRGCINDLLALDAWFKKMSAENGLRWRPRYLLAPHSPELPEIEAAGIGVFESPTRDNIIAAFAHFSAPEVAPGDVCLLYYSGHGSQEPATPEFRHLKSDGMNETIVCVDSRLPGGRDLVDKELASLLWNATRRRPGEHFLAIMDCCHSGSNTRNGDPTVATRDLIARSGGTPFTQLHGIGDLPEGARGLFELRDGKAWYREEGRYIQLAAARDSETAKELTLDGKIRGAFTWGLLHVLDQGGAPLSYREIMRRTEALVRNRVSGQIPQIEATDKTLENHRFLGRELEVRPPEYPVEFTNGRWQVRAGLLQGIAAGNERIPTLFRLNDPAQRTVAATGVTADRSLLDPASMAGISPVPAPGLQARVVQMPAPAISIYVDEEMPGRLRAALEAEIRKKALFHADFSAPTPEQSDYHCVSENRDYLLLRKGGTAPVFQRQEQAAQFVTFCESVGKWQAVLEMHNRDAASRIPREDIDIRVEIIEGQSVTPATLNFLQGVETADPEEITLHYSEAGAPALRCKVRVKPGMWVGGLYLDSRFGIADYLVPRQSAAPEEEHLFRFSNKNTDFNALPVLMDAGYTGNGVTWITDYLKIFVSTTDFKLADFRQTPLPFDTGNTRASGFEEENPAPVLPAWTVVTIPVRINRPAKAGPAAGFRAAGFTMETPPGFQATAALSSQADVRRKLEDTRMTRGEAALLEKFVLPPASIWGQAVVEDAVSARSFEVEPGGALSILELTGVTGDLSRPLLLRLDQKPGEDEAVLPFGYDPETDLYLPMGFTNPEGNVEIHALPPETPGRIHGEDNFAARDLKGSIKLFFKKIFQRRNGNTLVMVNPDGSSEHDTGRIREKIKRADRVLLFSHGIFGDSEDKKVAFTQKTDIHKMYDVMLAYDYENLATDLRETARDLFNRLKDCGLFDREERRLTVIGSSMGGLVSRWMVEREPAAPYVKHLIMVAVPNLGSDLAVFRQRLFGLIGRAMNGTALLKPYLIPLTFLAKKADKVFWRTLNDLHPTESGFLAELNDPKHPAPALVRYSLLGGNTANIAPEPDQAGHFWARLKFFLKKRLKYAVVNWLVFDGPNDMAVEVESQKGLRWLRPDETRIVALDHVSYFTEEEGLRNLKAFMTEEETA